MSANNVVQLNAGHAQPAQFSVVASASLQERRPRTLKHGDMFAVFDHNGDVLAFPGSSEGLYYCDTRHLSHLYMTLNGERPILLSSSLRDDNAALICDLTNPDLHSEAGTLISEHDQLHIRRYRLLWDGSAYERLCLRNYGHEPRMIRLGFSFAADFADVFEVRGAKRARRGQYQDAIVAQNAVTLGYTGLDGALRQTRLRFHPKPQKLDAGHAEFNFQMGPGETVILFAEIDCTPGEADVEPAREFFTAFRAARRAQSKARRQAVATTTSHDVFNELLSRSTSDLYMLVTETPEGPFPYAGIPWFSTAFGRDALITALQTLWMDPSLALGVLRHLAANQAANFDERADSEPGKILHELRRGEMAELGEVPFRRYYGSIDSTPLFVMLAGAYLERTGDLKTIRELWPHIELALNWIDDYGDRDRDGFVEYGRRTEKGLVNQGWKDSHDSISHRDGTLAHGPIALAEVQAYVYGAWMAAAEMRARLGYVDASRGLSARAQIFRRRFDEYFFDEELGTYVLALDGDKRPCRVKTSNVGHVLFTGLALPERAASVGAALMANDSFSGFGVRTLSTGEARYNPMSYHNGSIWPHDNALIAAGLSRYGLRAQCARIFEGVFSAATYMDLRRLPELYCGFPRQPGAGPVFYPVACAPQAWASATPLMLLQASLGLSFDAQRKRICFAHPTLPDFLDEVILRRLQVGGASADVGVRRSGSDVVVHVMARSGGCEVQTTH